MKSVSRNKIQSFLAFFVTVIAFLVFGLLSSLRDAYETGLELSSENRLITMNKINFTKPLPISYVQHIRNIEGVRAAASIDWFGGYYQDTRNELLMFAVEPENFLTVISGDIIVSPEQKARWLSNPRGLMVSEKTARRFGWSLGDQVPISSNIYPDNKGSYSWLFTIDAIYCGSTPQIDTSNMYLHYQYFNESRAFGKNYVSYALVVTNSHEINNEIIARIDREFANSASETKTMLEKEFNESFLIQLDNLKLILIFVVGSAFFVMLLLISNSMMLSVRGRAREIAVMKTMGFGSNRIFSYVLCEVLLVVFVAGTIGLGAAYFAIQWVNEAPIPFPTLLIQTRIIVQAMALMLALSLLAGLIPAFYAWRLTPIVGIRR